MKKCIIFLLVFISWINSNGQSKFIPWEDVKCNCDSIINACYKNPCTGLSLLSDSSYFFYKMNPYCFNRVCNYYYQGTKISHAQYLDFNNVVNYINLSLGKSLYKVDLLLWMKYYGCLDTHNLTQRIYGEFDKFERHEIRNWNHNGLKDKVFDSTILWQK